MPKIAEQNKHFIPNLFSNILRRVGALERRQSYPVYDGTAGYAAGVFQVGCYGIQPLDGTVSLQIVDKTGNLRVVCGQMPKSGTGDAYYGDYGLLLINSDGTMQEMLPVVSDFYSGSLSTASTSYVSLANSPSVVATLGASGDAVLTASSFIQTAAANTSGLVQVDIDSGAQSFEILQAGAGSSSIGVTTMFDVQLSKALGSTLTAGEHTFALQYKSSSGAATQTFTSTSIRVTPI